MNTDWKDLLQSKKETNNLDLLIQEILALSIKTQQTTNIEWKMNLKVIDKIKKTWDFQTLMIDLNYRREVLLSWQQVVVIMLHQQNSKTKPYIKSMEEVALITISHLFQYRTDINNLLVCTIEAELTTVSSNQADLNIINTEVFSEESLYKRTVNL